mmetsp:Transcript_79149/g.178666  ORF Transcript_79149/g.178666 Transcript_79149/m.178666 type:complete len:207 (+) Transcript_79149:67-687(+)
MARALVGAALLAAWASLARGEPAVSVTTTTTIGPVDVDFQGTVQMLVTEADAFLADPNVAASIPYAMAEQANVPVRYVTADIQKIPRVTNITTRLTWKLIGIQHLSRRSPVKLEYTVRIPATENVSSTFDHAVVNNAFTLMTTDSVQRSLRNAVADRTGTWAYVIIVTGLSWTEEETSGAKTRGPLALARALAVAAAVLLLPRSSL